MPKKGKGRKYPAQPLPPFIEARFKKLLAKQEPPQSLNIIGGYKTKNVNQLWHWQTLEDVLF